MMTVKQIILENYKLNREHILKRMVHWSISCFPLFKSKEFHDDRLIDSHTQFILFDIIKDLGIDVERPFPSAKTLTEPLNLRISILESENNRLTILHKDLLIILQKDRANFQRIRHLASLLSDRNLLFGVNPTIQWAASFFGVRLFSISKYDEIVKGGCDENH